MLFQRILIEDLCRWWNEQSQSKQEQVKKLVEQGRLEFAAGGLVMNDEATPYYEDIIDQVTWGHRFLYETFGVLPRIGWQLDPFGHSNSQAVLSYLFGMDAQYYARIDYQDKGNRLKNKEMEMILQPWTANKQHYPIFTHVNYEHYSSPQGFDFDVLRNSGGRITEYNQKEKANQLNNYFVRQAEKYKGNVIAHTLGDDNEWSQAKSYYQNIEMIMHYINNHPDEYNITIKFGTPIEHILALNEYTEEIFYPSKNDDFFPYADKEKCYWTGYFTSKPAFKGFVRYTGRHYQQLKSFVSYSLAKGNSEINDLKDVLYKSLKKLGYTMGVSQHHDAVTGTSKDTVTKDYVKSLHRDLMQANSDFNKLVSILIKKEIQEVPDQLFQYNYNATAQQCKEVYENLQNNQTILLTLVDTKINQGQQVIKLKVPKLYLNVIDSMNKAVEGDIICSNMRDDNDCNLFFNSEIKNGLLYYKIFQSTEQDASAKIIKQQTYTNITVNTKISLDDGPSFQLFYKQYASSVDNLQPSGAYIFRPNGAGQNYGDIDTVRVFNGSVVTEMNIKRDLVDTWVRKYKILESQYEVETFVESIQVQHPKGKEIVIVFKNEDIQNNKVFYTDSNGLDLQKRKIGHRETWSLQSNEYVAENYYPVNGIISIQNENSYQTMAVINDRSQGGSSFQQGEIEIMIHRRTLVDDRRGVGEGLNETEDNENCPIQPQQGKPCDRKIGLKQIMVHKIIFYDSKEKPNAARKVQLSHDFQPIKIFGKSTSTSFVSGLEIKDDLSILHQIRITPVSFEEAVAKLYIEPKENKDEFLLRIHNMQEEGNVQFYFPGVISYEETILSGLRSLTQQQTQRLVWNPTSKSEDETYIASDEVGPQQIKTFVIKI